jgi:hypothetical protein
MNPELGVVFSGPNKGQLDESNVNMNDLEPKIEVAQARVGATL